MLTDARKEYLKEKMKYKPKGSPNFFKKILRSNPYVYSLIERARIFYSRNILSSELKNKFQDNKELFILNAEEEKHVEELKTTGITIFPEFFDKDLIEKIDKKADELFKNREISNSSYHVNHGRISEEEFNHLSYEELEFFEESIAIKDPYNNIPDIIDIAFNERFLKIIANYFGYVPLHTAGVQRAFPQYPPVESSFFHKDSDSHDVLHIFVYLVDVDEKGGPFCYVPKSHKSDVKSCTPRTGYDLGDNKNYGRISDEEVEKVYPKDEWFPVKAKKGSVVITHVNGLHKGPMWGDYGDENRPRDIINVNFRSVPIEKSLSSFVTQKNIIPEENLKKFSELQKLFYKHL